MIMVDETTKMIYEIVERELERIEEWKSVGVEVHTTQELTEAYIEVNAWLRTLGYVRSLPETGA